VALWDVAEWCSGLDVGQLGECAERVATESGAADCVGEVDQHGEALVLLHHAVGDRDMGRGVYVLDVRVEDLGGRDRGRAVDANDDLGPCLVGELPELRLERGLVTSIPPELGEPLEPRLLGVHDGVLKGAQGVADGDQHSGGRSAWHEDEALVLEYQLA
jgi:hypothetical protein